MVWTCDKKRWRRASHRYYAMKRSEDVENRWWISHGLNYRNGFQRSWIK
jgi:hypothetical protein